MKEELLILPAEPEHVFEKGDLEKGKFTELVRRWNAHGSMKREPAYVAFYIKGEGVRAIAEVDYENSKLKDGIIATTGEPIRVTIPIRFKPITRKKETLQKFTYTTFRKLITHKTADEL